MTKKIAVEKVSTTNQNYISNNLTLVLPIFTYLIFNFFKKYFFEGYLINFVELFYMIMTTTIVYCLTLTNICGVTYNPGKYSLQHPLRYALILLFIINLINIINPCKKYMTYPQSNFLFIILLLIIFNVINYIISKNKDTCKIENNNMIVLILLAFNIGLVYINKD
jgi:hypothetical protein